MERRRAFFNDIGLPKKKPFGQMTWADIKTIANIGYVNSNNQWCVKNDTDVWFNLYDEKSVTLTTGYTFSVMIYDFLHDDKVSGGKAAFTLGAKILPNTSAAMESPTQSVTKWSTCTMRTQTLPALFTTLPAELRSCIENVYKDTLKSYLDHTIERNAETLWLFSKQEAFGSESEPYSLEGSHYPTLATRVDRRRKKAGASDNMRWWLRSVTATVQIYSNVTRDGDPEYYAARNTIGICFGFCI